MVLFHSLRVYRSILRGRYDRPSVIKAYSDLQRSNGSGGLTCTSSGEPVVPLCSESRCTFYMGLRMTDAFGHINNSRYVEAMELARWHQMASTGLYERVKRAQLMPVVSSVDVQYLREIKPCTKVLIRTQIGPASGRNMVFHQQIESLDRATIHASGLIRFAWLNSPAYRNVDGSRGGLGPISVSEALARAGYPDAMIRSYLDGTAFEDLASTRYYGPLSTTDDTQLSDTFSTGIITKVNEIDETWRMDLRQAVKKRKAIQPP